jgi:transposase
MWSYCTPSSNPTRAVVFDFSETRSGENVREFLQLDTPSAWKGTLVTDGFTGYLACFDKGGDLGAVHGARQEEVPRSVGQPRQRGGAPGAALPREPVPHRARDPRLARRRPPTNTAAQVVSGARRVPALAAGAAAIGAARLGDDEGHRLQLEALERTHALRRRRRRADLQQLGGEPHPADRAGKIELVVRREPARGQAGRGHHSLLHSARINGHEPYAYLKDVLERLPTQPASRIDELLAHRAWTRRSCCASRGGDRALAWTINGERRLPRAGDRAAFHDTVRTSPHRFACRCVPSPVEIGAEVVS